MTESPRSLIGWLAACGVVFIWSGWIVISRLGITQTLNIYDMIALRFLVSAVLVLPFAFAFWPRGMRWWQVLLISFGQGVPYLLLAFGGMQYAPTSHAGILMNGTLPVFAAILGWIWLRERPTGQRFIGMAVILIGCILIGWDKGSVGIGPDIWIGHLMFLGATVFVAINMIGTKAWQLSPMQAMVSIPIINLAWYGPLYFFALPKAINTAPWSEIILQGGFQGIGPSMLAALLFTTAIRTIGPAPTAAMMAMVPGLATLMAIPVLSEWPSALAWAGLVLATCGIFLAAGLRLRARRASVTA